MGNIDVLLCDYCHEQVSRLSRLTKNTKHIMNCDKINDYAVENSEIFLVIIMITADFDYHHIQQLSDF